MLTNTQKLQAVETSDRILDGEPLEPIKKCMQCQRFYFKRGVASIYVEPQRGAATHGICGPCDILYRQKYSISPLAGRKSL